MANEITGRIIDITPTQTVTLNNGKPFTKRTLVVDTTRFNPYTGQREAFERQAAFEIIGDRCQTLDSFRTGQVVTVNFDIESRKFQSQADTEPRWFTSVRAYRVTPYRQQDEQQQPQPQPTQQPQPQPQPQQQYQQQPQAGQTYLLTQPQYQPMQQQPYQPQPQAEQTYDPLPF